MTDRKPLRPRSESDIKRLLRTRITQELGRPRAAGNDDESENTADQQEFHKLWDQINAVVAEQRTAAIAKDRVAYENAQNRLEELSQGVAKFASQPDFESFNTRLNVARQRNGEINSGRDDGNDREEDEKPVLETEENRKFLELREKILAALKTQDRAVKVQNLPVYLAAREELEQLRSRLSTLEDEQLKKFKDNEFEAYLALRTKMDKEIRENHDAFPNSNLARPTDAEKEAMRQPENESAQKLSELQAKVSAAVTKQKRGVRAQDLGVFVAARNELDELRKELNALGDEQLEKFKDDEFEAFLSLRDRIDTELRENQDAFPNSNLARPTNEERAAMLAMETQQLGPERPTDAEREAMNAAAAEREAAVRAERERTLLERLNTARDNYLRQKKEWEKAQGVKSWFTDNSHIQVELVNLEAAYKIARAEYVEVSLEKAMGEEKTFGDAERALFAEQNENKLAKFYKNLGETSILGVDVKNTKSRFKKFAFNNRTLINGALLAVSVYSGPIGWGIAAGAWGARRLFTSLGAGVATMELAKNARRAAIQKDLHERPAATLQELNDNIKTFEARARLDGTSLVDNQIYQANLAARNEKMRADFETLSPEDRALRVLSYFDEQEDKLDEKVRKEKNWNRAAIAAGFAAGALVGTGVVGKALRAGIDRMGIGDWFHTSVAEAHQGSDINLPNESVKVGSRGIEGALLDLKGEKADQMYKWLAAQDYNKGVDVSNHGALVHRWAEHAAHESGANIDHGGGKDLSRNYGADLRVGANGEIRLGKVDFMPAAHEAAGAMTPENTPHVHADAAGHVESPDINKIQDSLNASHNPAEVSPDNEPHVHSDADQAVGETSDNGRDASVAETSAEQELTNSRLTEALAQEKLSKGLRITAEHTHKALMEHLGVSNGNLDKIGKLKYSEFIEKYNSDPKFHKVYAPLVSRFQEFGTWANQLRGGDRVDELVLRYSSAFEQANSK